MKKIIEVIDQVGGCSYKDIVRFYGKGNSLENIMTLKKKLLYVTMINIDYDLRIYETLKITTWQYDEEIFNN